MIQPRYLTHYRSPRGKSVHWVDEDNRVTKCGIVTNSQSGLYYQSEEDRVENPINCKNCLFAVGFRSIE